MRLGDLNALKEDLRRFFPTEVLEGIEPKTLFAQILHDIDNAPTVNPYSHMQKKNEDEKINCLDCKYCYENDTFNFAEHICVNAQSEYFGVHVYSGSPDICNEFLFGNKESNNAQNS